MPLPHAPEVVRFGPFEFRPRTGELRKSGLRLKLQEQPVRILLLLLETPGELVSREQIQKRLWPNEVYVDYENAINSAMRKLREALSDTSGNPRFIETLPRRGYRFIAAVEVIAVEEVAASTPKALPERPRWRRSWLLVPVLVVVAAASGPAVFHTAPEGMSTGETLIPEPLTSYPGVEMHPSFSPDGNQVAFSWITEDGSSSDIYLRSIGPGQPLRLTKDGNSRCPAWSPDGRWIAFTRVERNTNVRPMCGVEVIPPLGGPVHEVARFYGEKCSADGWSPDGHWVVVSSAEDQSGPAKRIALVSVEAGEKRWLTPPEPGRPANAFGGMVGDWYGVISPDGQTLAFARYFSGAAGSKNSSDIYTLSLERDYSPKEEPKRLTFDNVDTEGIAWTADSRALVFSSAKGGLMALWRIAVHGTAKPVLLPLGDNASGPTISTQGHRLAYETYISADSNIWRVNLLEPAAHAAPFIASTRLDKEPQYSPDGTKIAFQSFRSGNSEVWICDSDGSNAWQLTTTTASGTPNWSPDGQSIAFDSTVGHYWQVFTVGARGGTPRQITSDQIGSYRASWSRDGKWIWFKRTNGIWKAPSGGGRAVQIVAFNNVGDLGVDPVESEDGKTVWFGHAGSIWRAATDGSDQRMVIEHVERSDAGSFFVVKREGAWYVGSGPPSVRFFNLATKKSQLVFNPSRPLGGGMTVSPDRHWLLYCQYDTPDNSDLMLVRNFF
ncbi:MAG TPA: winged helix-turn-helix domain-containing protein [Bryobacteraceae bacterium]|nr:winged helix-turn-helix domain-containing protein [Bryobacteraceae bacterium]